MLGNFEEITQNITNFNQTGVHFQVISLKSQFCDNFIGFSTSKDAWTWKLYLLFWCCMLPLQTMLGKFSKKSIKKFSRNIKFYMEVVILYVTLNVNYNQGRQISIIIKGEGLKPSNSSDKCVVLWIFRRKKCRALNFQIFQEKKVLSSDFQKISGQKGRFFYFLVFFSLQTTKISHGRPKLLREVSYKLALISKGYFDWTGYFSSILYFKPKRA